jgi:hypothetical protein
MYDHLARMRVKAYEKRKELKAQREAEANELKELRASGPAAVQARAPRKKVAIAAASPCQSSSESSDSDSDTDSDRSPSPPPAPKPARKRPSEATPSDTVARKLLRMEKELWKLKFKERYAKKAQAAALHSSAPAPPPTPVAPVVVQVPESRKGPSDAASLAREALALAGYASGTGATAHKPTQRTIEFPGGYRPLF